MMAIAEAIKIIQFNELQGDFAICTDSMSSVLKLKSLGLDSNLSSQAAFIKQQIFNESSQGRIIRVIWIPAHVGIRGNEAADVAAKAGGRRVPIDNLNLNWNDFKSIIKDQARTRTAGFILDYANFPSSRGSRFVQFSPEFRETTWFRDKGLNRRRVGVANRLMTGHNRTKAHLHRMNILADGACDCGEGAETLEHIFWRCPRFLEPRIRLKDYLNSKNIRPDVDIDELAIKGDFATLVRLVAFIIDNDIMI